MLRRDSPTPREHMSERLRMRDRMALPHSVCHHHEFVKTSHRGSHETCSTQVLTEPSVGANYIPEKRSFRECANRYYQNGAMMCQRTGVRRLHMALEALLIAVTVAKHLKFKDFKNFAGLLCQERVL